jgi:hypothetical protein
MKFDPRTAGGVFRCEKNDAWDAPAVTGAIVYRFVEYPPKRRANGEVRSIFASKLCQVAYRLADRKLREALVALALAHRFDAASARRFAGKFFSLFLSHERVRALLSPAAVQGQRVL